MPALEPDSSIRLPEVSVIKASAGSGKTYTLTERYVQFALSRVIPKNGLRNVLAVTFSNNASREMKRSVLDWLKLLHFGDPERLAAICAVVGGGEKDVRARSGALIEKILSEYSDFQIRTIDSFMSLVFRASALDFGFNPEFEILLDSGPLLDYAFNLYLREARAGSARGERLDRTVRALLGFQAEGDRFPWDPAAALLSELKRLDARLSLLDVPLSAEDTAPDMRKLEDGIREALERTRSVLHASGLEANGRSTLPRALEAARSGRFAALIGMGMKTVPAKKPARGAPADAYEEIESAWEEACGLVSRYAGLYARSYYLPYLAVHADMQAAAERAKKNRGEIFIGDIGRRLGEHLREEMIPDVYFRLGEKIFHFLIDEFQDTSPSQWRNLFPLIENSLASGGSLFVVGDTKQAIYGFRQADFTIMKGLETENPFPSSRHRVSELPDNFRSKPRILSFVEEVFKENAAAAGPYREAARASGLDLWVQNARKGSDAGYAEVEILDGNDEDPPERARLHAVMEELSRRGYRWSDIAVLAQRNGDVARATSWLNEKGIPFISFSSLDVRRRRIASEIIRLLAFLDSPPDDLSFAAFIGGEIFTRTLRRRPGWESGERIRDFLFANRENPPLYKAFQDAFPDIWDAYFSGLFRSAGYLPLYDLASDIYAVFDLFRTAGEEEATLAKLLEAVKDHEGSGVNSLRDFLRSASDAESDASGWAIEVPRGADCVQAMTIHKAKGLGFPVTVVLLYGETRRGFEHAVLRGEGGAVMVKLTQKTAEKDPALAALYEEEILKRRVNDLNALYVALTRAKSEMYVIGVRGKTDSFPFDILPGRGFAPAPEKGPVRSEGGAPSASAPLAHAVRPSASVISTSRLALNERRRGEMIHRILSFITYAGADLENALMEAAARTVREYREEGLEAELTAGLAEVIRSSGLRAFFAADKERTVFTEQEFCDENGRLSRMDRVVVDPDRVAVIDYKTGYEEDAEEKHEPQIRGYMSILAEVFPKRTVEALLVYTNRREIRRLK